MSEPSGDSLVARALLGAAGLPASDEEAANFALAYPILRAQADSLYLPFLDEVAPAFGFTATFEEVTR